MRAEIVKINSETPEVSLIKYAADQIRSGEVLGMPTDTFYGLAADPFNLRAVERVYDIKTRSRHKPLSLLIESTDQAVASLKRFTPYLAPLQAGSIEKGGSGADVGELGALGAVTIGYVPDSTHYFDFHHSARDRIEAVDIKDLHAGAAAMATLVYLIAEKGP